MNRRLWGPQYYSMSEYLCATIRRKFNYTISIACPYYFKNIYINPLSKSIIPIDKKVSRSLFFPFVFPYFLTEIEFVFI